MTIREDAELHETQLAYFSYQPDEDRLVLRSCSWPDIGPLDAKIANSDEIKFAIGLEMRLVCHVAKSGEAIYLPDCRADERWIEDTEMRAIFIVPVSTVGPCDVLVLASQVVDGISPRERALAHMLVRHVGQPGRSATHREARVARLERGLRRIRLEVSQLAVDSDEPGQAFPDGMAERLRLLSPREWQVLERLRSGRRVVTIASELTISPNTVRNHLKSIYRKLGVRSQVELLERLRGAEPCIAAAS
jgi:DNA-binding CsgD family transcriptional regulator